MRQTTCVPPLKATRHQQNHPPPCFPESWGKSGILEDRDAFLNTSRKRADNLHTAHFNTGVAIRGQKQLPSRQRATTHTLDPRRAHGGPQGRADKSWACQRIGRSCVGRARPPIQREASPASRFCVLLEFSASLLAKPRLLSQRLLVAP